MFEVKTMKGSRVIAKIAGIESTAVSVGSGMPASAPWPTVS